MPYRQGKNNLYLKPIAKISKITAHSRVRSKRNPLSTSDPTPSRYRTPLISVAQIAGVASKMIAQIICLAMVLDLSVLLRRLLATVCHLIGLANFEFHVQTPFPYLLMPYPSPLRNNNNFIES